MTSARASAAASAAVEDERVADECRDGQGEEECDDSGSDSDSEECDGDASSSSEQRLKEAAQVSPPSERSHCPPRRSTDTERTKRS